jgi:sugar O-acyltransferase (sialic acid O-acetyltransferase NeuD family)
MKPGLLGFGDLGRQVKFLLETAGLGPFVLFDDPASDRGEKGVHRFADWKNQEYASHSLYLCLGYRHMKTRRELAEEIERLGRSFPSFVHPSSFVSPSAKIADGAILYPGCNVDQGVRIGSGVLLNNSVVVSHDSEIGTGAFLAPGAVVCGSVKIGAGSFIGAGAVIVNGVRIGRDCRVGAGSLISEDLPDGASAIGNPARALKTPLELR